MVRSSWIESCDVLLPFGRGWPPALDCGFGSVALSMPLDSSLRNVKQNDFNNEAAGSGCGDVKQNNFKIDDILDGFVSAIIGVFESAV